jgi:hypothetical protein
MKGNRKEKESFESMKRRAEDREILCRGPAGRQKTNDDDQNPMMPSYRAGDRCSD